MRNDLPPGLFGNRYRAVRELGRGGFATVYEAWDEVASRRVALKLVDRRALDLAGGMHRFHREATVLQHLAHPNIVRAYDAGEHGGAPYLVLELLDGVTVEAALRDHGAMPAARVVIIARGLLGALADAHRAGVVHRDVKPANVFLCGIGGVEVAKLLDFGIAKADGMDVAKTAMGATLGTAAYMAPEQVTGDPVGPPADLFAVGLLIAEALCGERVYGGGSGLAILVAKASGKPVALPAAVVRSPFGALVARAVQLDPADRFASADAMRDALEAVASGLGVLPEGGSMRPADPLGATAPLDGLKRAAMMDSTSGTWDASAVAAGVVVPVSPSHAPSAVQTEDAYAETATHVPLAPQRTSIVSGPPGSDPGEKVEASAETERAPSTWWRRRARWLAGALIVAGLCATGVVVVIRGDGDVKRLGITVVGDDVIFIDDGDLRSRLATSKLPRTPVRECIALETADPLEVARRLAPLGLRDQHQGAIVTMWLATKGSAPMVPVSLYRVTSARVKPRGDRDRVFAEMKSRLSVQGPTFASATRILVVPTAAGMTADQLEKLVCR